MAELELSPIISVEYIDYEKGQITLQDGSGVQFEWWPGDICQTLREAVEAYQSHCQGMIDMFAALNAPASTGPERSRLVDGKSYWVYPDVVNGVEQQWFVAKYRCIADGVEFWESPGLRFFMGMEQVLKVGNEAVERQGV